MAALENLFLEIFFKNHTCLWFPVVSLKTTGMYYEAFKIRVVWLNKYLDPSVILACNNYVRQMVIFCSHHPFYIYWDFTVKKSSSFTTFYLISYLYQYRFLDIYFTVQVIIPYYILLLMLSQVWPLGMPSSWRPVCFWQAPVVNTSSESVLVLF